MACLSGQSARRAPGPSRATSTFFRADNGATAIEFALIAPLLLLLTSMWLELALVIFTQQVLDKATRDASRLIRLGQSPTQSAFNAAVCSKAAGLLTCANIQSRVQSAASPGFASLSASVTSTSSGTMSSTSYSTGASGYDVLVQVGYTRTIYTPFVAAFLGTSGKLLLLSTVALQVEPTG